MRSRRNLTTVVSTRGQVNLPKEVRDARQWAPGTRLVVEETEGGVLLRPAAPRIAQTRPEDVFGSLARPGKSMSIEEMEESLAREARRHAGD